jgi:hypothetical protein
MATGMQTNHLHTAAPCSTNAKPCGNSIDACQPMTGRHMYRAHADTSSGIVVRNTAFY